MYKIWLIAKREYLERIRTKSFVVMTVLIPVLMVGSLFGVSLVNGREAADAQIAIVAPAAAQQFASDLRTELEHGKNRMGVELISPATPETRSELDGELTDKDLDGYLWITAPEQADGRPSFVYTPRSQSDMAAKNTISHAIVTVFAHESLSRSGSSAFADALTQPVDLNSSQATRNDRSRYATGSTVVLFLLMYFVILLYGMNVARSIIEEKTSRVFEVLLATIRPEEMMAGKVIGVGSVGLTQAGIWLAAAIVLTATPLIAHFTGSRVHIEIGVAQIVFFIVYFLLGYLLYSSMAAALGAMTNSEQELQQLNMFLVAPLALCTVLVGFVIKAPGGVVSRLFSLVPFTSPLIMYTRISLQMPPWYEVASSIAILVASILAVLWIASRIYRVGILMYGKKPNLSEILRWLKYS